MGRKSKIEAHPDWMEYVNKVSAVLDASDRVFALSQSGKRLQADLLLHLILQEMKSLDHEYESTIKAMWKAAGRRTETISKADREYVIRKYKHRCAYCGMVGDKTIGPDGASWQIDHIIPYSWDGVTERGNFALACRRCNCKKHDKWWCPNV